MAYKQEPGRKPSAFGEVLKSRGLINTISNPKAAKKQASDIRIARLKEELASKPKNPNPTFFTMEAYKPEGTLENPTVRQYYKTERTAGGDFVSRELSLDYTKKQNKIAVKKDNETYERRLNKPLSDGTKEQYIKIITRITNLNSVKIYRDLPEILDYVFTGKELQKYHYRYFKVKMQYTTHINDRFYDYMKQQYPNKITLKVYLIPYVVLFGYLSNDKYFKKKI